MTELSRAAWGSAAAPSGGAWSLVRRCLDPCLLLGLGVVLGVGLVALLAPWLAPHDPLAYSAPPLAAPSLEHPLGANSVGQDILSELIYGARVTLTAGLLVGVISTAIAWGLGLLSGLSRRADAAVRGVADLMLILPPIVLIILIAAYLGASTLVVVVTLSLISWGPFARIIRGQVQSEVRKPYIEAARALGASAPRILLRHVAPATVSTAVAKFVLTVQYAIVIVASLAFLGLGDPTSVSWGSMAHQAAQSPIIFISRAWLWWLLPPSLAIGLLVISFMLIGWAVEERSLPGRQTTRRPLG